MGSGNQELARAGNGASSDTDDADDWSSGDWRELVQEKDHQITELNKKITSGWGQMGPDGAGWGRQQCIPPHVTFTIIKSDFLIYQEQQYK